MEEYPNFITRSKSLTVLIDTWHIAGKMELGLFFLRLSPLRRPCPKYIRNQDDRLLKRALGSEDLTEK